MSSIVLRTPSSDAKDWDIGETHSKGPGYITSLRWRWAVPPRPAAAHTPEHKLERR